MLWLPKATSDLQNSLLSLFSILLGDWWWELHNAGRKTQAILYETVREMTRQWWIRRKRISTWGLPWMRTSTNHRKKPKTCSFHVDTAGLPSMLLNEHPQESMWTKNSAGSFSSFNVTPYLSHASCAARRESASALTRSNWRPSRMIHYM